MIRATIGSFMLAVALTSAVINAIKTDNDNSKTTCPGCFTTPAILQRDVDTITVLSTTFATVADVTTGAARPLLMDGYLPPLASGSASINASCPGGTTAPSPSSACRPVIVLVHGGSCAVGSRRDSYLTEIAIHFAVRGYATFTIDYRLAGSCFEGGSTIAANDVKSAVRFLRTQAAVLSLDTSRIALAGASAGAVAVLEAVITPGPGDSGGNLPINHGAESSAVHAVVSISGALLNLDVLPQPNQTVSWPPFYLFHGTNDGIVPTDGSISFSNLAAQYNQTAILRLASGVDHASAARFITTSYAQDVLWFLIRSLRLHEADTPAACLLSPISMCNGTSGAGAINVLPGLKRNLALPSTFDFAGQTRIYHLQLPPAYLRRSGPLPVVLAFHGGKLPGKSTKK